MKASKSRSRIAPSSIKKILRRSPAKITHKVGLPPGSIVYTGVPKDQETSITVMRYNAENVSFNEVKDLEELRPGKGKDEVTWINLDSVHDVDLVSKVGEMYNVHNLTLEDVVQVGHIPKMDEYDNYLFLVMKMVKPEPESGNFILEQVSFVLGEDFLITFQEQKGDPFDNIRDRIQTGKGKARGRTVDYLMFLLIDAIVDQYLLSIEEINKSIDEIEMEILEEPRQEVVAKIAEEKKTISGLRRLMYPVRDALKNITLDESEFIQADYYNYYNDVYDHLKQIVETLDSQSESLTSVMEFYMSQVSNQMNKVMQVLTMIATIFIPLTFLAGIYGMNFQYMPELAWKWSYPVLLAIMLAIGISMYFYMRKKKWF